MAHPEEPQGTLTAAVAPAAAAVDSGRVVRSVLLMFAATAIVVILVYVAMAVPRAWFPAAQRIEWSVADMTVTRGQGGVRDGVILAAPADATGIVVISLNTKLRSADYTTLDWDTSGVPPDAEVRLLWRADLAPTRVNALPLKVTSTGEIERVRVDTDPNWLGTVVGLALAVQGAPAEGIRVRGLAATPMGAAEVVGTRFREWFQFDPWSGTSINTVTGAAEGQAVPLPVALFVVGLLTVGFWYAPHYRRGGVTALPLVIATAFVAAWCISDLRWTAQLVRQARVTLQQFAGKSLDERHRAAEDGTLYAFVQQARAKLPSEPVRVIVAAEARYFRGRAAYHLYPHNVYFEPNDNALPKPEQLRSGDYLLVFQRRNVQFDAKDGLLRWDGNAPMHAELVLVRPGAALFKLL